MDCSYNKLKLFDGSLNSLTTLNCSFNYITKLPTNLCKLKILICAYNEIQEIPMKLLLITKKIYCDNYKYLIRRGAFSALTKYISYKKWHYIINNWVICKRLLDLNLNDASYIITQYI